MHPRVEKAASKEPNYFNKRPGQRKSEEWYRRQLGGAENRLHGDATVGYFESLKVPPAVRAFNPDVRLVVLLRDPVRRAWSSFWERPKPARYKGGVPGGVRMLWDDLLQPAKVWGAEHVNIPWGHVRRGVYIFGLNNWLCHFPREQLLVLRSEDMFADPNAVYQRVLAHIGLEPFELPVYQKYASKSRGRLPEDLVAALQNFYRPYNAELKAKFGIGGDY